MSLHAFSSEKRLVNKYIFGDFCGAIRGKCEKCLNSGWNCLEMT